MKKIPIAVLAILTAVILFGQKAGRPLSVIPIPVSVQSENGNFTLSKSAAIETRTNNADAKRVAVFLAKKLSDPTGFAMPVRSGVSSNSNGNISITLNNDTTLGNEGYTLQVTPHIVSLSANKPAGLFYGMQTLMQLLPKEIESKTAVKNIPAGTKGVAWTIPCVTIRDYPRFTWRGLLLDVSRHFFSKDQVKIFIDNMVRYKYNLLHLHLTDDQGWRIEIKSYPKLTTVGAWRANREGAWSNTKAPDPSEPKTYGGFYTQDDIRELLQYAKERFVTILPEIDVPAHSMAALAAYPELSCTPGTYAVNVGE